MLCTGRLEVHGLIAFRRTRTGPGLIIVDIISYAVLR